MNEPQSLHELHQEDAEEERKRKEKFDQMAKEAMPMAYPAVVHIREQIRKAASGLNFWEEDILVIAHALSWAVRANMTEIPAPLWKRQIIESLEEVMLICQERIDQDLIDASDSLEARERT